MHRGRNQNRDFAAVSRLTPRWPSSSAPLSLTPHFSGECPESFATENRFNGFSPAEATKLLKQFGGYRASKTPHSTGGPHLVPPH